MSENSLPRLLVHELQVSGALGCHRAYLSVCLARSASAYLATIPFLHPNERVFYEALQYEQRRTSYLKGRYAAKHAVAAYVREEQLERVWIDQGILRQPLVVHPHAQNLQVSITHCDELGAALVFPEALPMGLDVERINPVRQAALAAQMTAPELELIRSGLAAEEVMLTLFWSAKEALSKVLKTGLAIPFAFLEIAKLERKGTAIFGTYAHFPQYVVACWVFGEHVCTVAYSRRAELSLERVRDVLSQVEYAMDK
ncbi:4'-phosphopantetheinyl transferase family protein [Tumebacillus permanentifrigoris]|nr:4'-phosphopantetheinyl transferase superfamily protein [Tumebacillus permanentifrigoris]